MARTRQVLSVLLVLAFLAGCAPATPAPTTPTALPTEAATATAVPPTATAVPTATASPSPTPIPVVTYGPANFPAEVNPLTGLEVSDPQILNRRPVIVKVQNIPRTDRPQYGLSLADIVYEYYTEEGSTRFAAIYYGQDAEVVAPIRSARFFDIHLLQMYRGVFVFGSAYENLRYRLYNSDFYQRLIIESNNYLPAVKRYDPNGRNYLSVNTGQLNDVLAKMAVDNTRQNLDGMYFSTEAPAGGQAAEQVYARFSTAIYNRWDYDEETGRYLRFSDKENAPTSQNEVYEPLTDALNEEPIAADNIVIIEVPHEIRDPRAGTEVVDMLLLGQGPAYLVRDGQIYTAQWQRLTQDAVLTLVDENGQLLAFKPGQTWFEVMGKNSKHENVAGSWRFTFGRDW